MVGTLAGHSVGYRVAVPDAHERAHVLASSGHGYLAYVPLVIALCVSLVAVGIVALVLAALRGRDTSGGTRQIKLVAAFTPAAIAFALATAAHRVAQAIRTGRRPRARSLAITFLSWLSVDLPREPVLARGYTGRGPPRLT